MLLVVSCVPLYSSFVIAFPGLFCLMSSCCPQTYSDLGAVVFVGLLPLIFGHYLVLAYVTSMLLRALVRSHVRVVCLCLRVLCVVCVGGILVGRQSGG